MRNYIPYVIVGLVLLAVAYVFLSGVVQIRPEKKQDNQKQEVAKMITDVANNADLKIEDQVVGTGTEATAGKTVTVNYIGTLLDGTKFDASADHGQPFSFTLGQGQVIQGWDLGVTGMKVGGKRKLTIPPKLAYGDQAAGTIPPNSTLVFEIELLDVK